jgi:autotransporter-associated beta strand protein
MKTRYTRLLTSLFATSSAGILQAAVYNWNGSTTGGATGTSNTWNTTTANWTGSGTLWPTSGSDNDAVFAGTAGTVTIASAVTANDLTFNTNNYIVSGGTLTLNGTTPTITTANSVGATISSVLAGSAGLIKTGSSNTGVLTLSGNNTLSGSVSINSGILRITHGNALGTSSKTVNLNGGSGIAANLELRLDPGAGGSLTLPSAIAFSTATNSGAGIRNKSGNNEIRGNVNVRSGLGSTTVGSDAGTLTMSGTISAGASGRTLILNGNSTTPNTVSGSINNGSGLALSKGGTGTWVVSGSNNFAGGTTVSSGKLIVTGANGLGTGNVAVSAGANLSYAAATDAPLALGGTLAITGGTTTPTTIGCAIGATPTSASINVAGDASITDAAHAIDLFCVPGTTAEDGTYTLISGTGAGSSLAPTTAPTIGKVYNNTNFSVGGFTRSATALQVDITALTPLTEAYWVGGLAGSPNVWAVSNGSTSNWAATAAGSAQALVPGSATNVIVSGNSPAEAPVATLLGADMTINSLTIADSVNGLGLNDDGYTLKLLADGLTMTAGAAASSIAAKVGLDGDQTWTLGSANLLNVTGVLSGSSALTKAGTGTLALAAANTHTGVVQVTAGTLSLANASALASSTLLRDATDTGALAYDAAAATTYNLGGLSGDGTLDGGGKTLSIGGNNQSTVFSGSLGNAALTKLGTGTLMLSGANDFTGAVAVNAGRLTLAHSDALGTGPKEVSMQGTNRTLYLENNISIPANVTFTLSTNSGDGSGLNNESGSNSILGNINYSVGNPGLNISSASGTLSIAGDVTLVTSGRPLYLGGASATDNTISGDIGENSAAVMPVIKQGAGKWILSGTNTYKGDTTVNGGSLVLANGGSQRFLPLSNATSNKITGNGSTITLDGALDFVLTGTGSAADAPNGTDWLIVDVANLAETYDTNFTVTGFTETALDSGVWEKTVGARKYTFTQSSGLLEADAAGTPFQTWAAANITAIDAGADASATGDPDDDGTDNLAEFALAGDPLDGSDNGLTRFGIEDVSGTDHLTLTFACRSASAFSGAGPASVSQDGVTYSVRATTDLGTFTLPLGEVAAIPGDLPAAPVGYTYRTFRVVDAVSANPKAFIQLQTTATP